MIILIVLALTVPTFAFIVYPFFRQGLHLVDLVDDEISQGSLENVAGVEEEIEKQIQGVRRGKASNMEEEIEKKIAQLRQSKGQFCPKCGAKHQPDDRFCSRCGAILS